jgi:uncharacterized protein
MKKNTNQEKAFPEGMSPLTGTFSFSCHSNIKCYRKCCHTVDLLLYPYDILQIKNHLKISSEEFLDRYTMVISGNNPYFPSVAMKMADTPTKNCPFLGQDGCNVYSARPSVCRTYPLERAVDRTLIKGKRDEFFFLTNHDYCLGHQEGKEWSVKEWLRDQNLQYYHVMEDFWTEIDNVFSKNPWQGEGSGGPRQLLAFMVCYNLDRFRKYLEEHELLDQYKLSGSRKRLIKNDDEALLKFGFDWLKLILDGQPTLKERRRGGLN